MKEVQVAIHTPSIELQAFLKWSGHVIRGGDAKTLVKEGAVAVNGAEERRRSRRLVNGDRVDVEGKAYVVLADHAP